MIIYIRHGDDEYEDPTHRHDKRITRKGKKRAQRMARKLIRKYGSPSKIICSPFKRTLGTARVMKAQIPSGRSPTLYIDPNLSRYFCAREKYDPSVYPQTQKYPIPIYESHTGFERRVKQHIQRMERKHYASRKRVIWCITHALVYKRIAAHYSIAIPKSIPFLHFFVCPSSKKMKSEKNPIS